MPPCGTIFTWRREVKRSTGTGEDEAEEEDFRFWYKEMTPEERVRAVEECLLSSLRARGINEIPRLQRVCRVIKRE